MFKITVTLLGLLMAFISGIAQIGLIQNTQSRNMYSLNGTWHYHIDPTGAKLNKNKQERFDNALNGYDWTYANTLEVPGDYNHQVRELFLYEGAVWYQREFSFTPTPGKRYFLYFAAVENEAEVYLNEKKVGSHKGAYTPFNFEITEHLAKGSNSIIVGTRNYRDRHDVPPTNYDWWNYGGITRDVMILELPELFIENYHIQLSPTSLDSVRGWVKLSEKLIGQAVTVEIPEAKWRFEGETDTDGKIWISSPIKNISYWSPDNPKRYDLAISIEGEKLKDKVGLRTIEVSGNQILLNKEAVFLKGICMHDEIPQRQARTNTEADSRMLLNWAKAMNCNFIRLAHYTHNEQTIRLADELGLLLWSEIPTYWQVDFGSEIAYERAKNQLTEMIERDRNRASVIIWSVANETNPGEDRQKFLKGLIDHAKEIDGTRLVTAALKKKKVPLNSTLQECDDPLMEYVDVIALNEYIGWYPNQGLNGLPSDCDLVTWNIPQHLPLIISEFGAGALYGYHGSDTTRWTEEFQLSLYQHTFEMLAKIPNLRGVSPWLLADYLSPKRKNTYFQNFWNRKGLISSTGKKKKAFYFLRAYYENR